jgi:molecular chaperone GrpE
MTEEEKRKKKNKSEEEQGDSASAPGDGVQGGDPQGAAPEEEKTMMVALSMEEYDTLQKELEQARKDASDNFEGWQRERADLANYRRLVERDQTNLTQNIQGEIIKKFLPVQDDLERALKVCPPHGEGKDWAEGVALILRKMSGILEAYGVERIPADGDFDHNLHEAISLEQSADHPSGQIIEVLENGYKIGDRVLRPARVRVAK